MKHRVCDYEGSDYEAFWPGREYEDAAERIALRRLLPPEGEALVELGAGFGRLADLYQGYKRVILLDFARSQLLKAHKKLGEGKFIYVAADIYRLPLASSAFDTAVTVRVLHHIADIPAALAEVHRILKPQGTYILEYANKRNLKEILRYLLGRSQKRPFSHEPYEYQDMHFNLHPAYISASLREAGFTVKEELAVSLFRLPLLKRLLAPGVLAYLDGLLQKPAAGLKLSPSIFVAARAVKKEGEAPKALFRCLYCYTPLQESVKDPEGKETTLFCARCGQEWRPQEGVYDFREPERIPS
ncbi:MAG: class I SAM-dependent methyltransferase [Anaerolineae bacterium]